MVSKTHAQASLVDGSASVELLDHLFKLGKLYEKVFLHDARTNTRAALSSSVTRMRAFAVDFDDAASKIVPATPGCNGITGV